MILSMTGYATASAELDSGSLALELRAVNHRYLDIQLRMPDEWLRTRCVRDLSQLQRKSVPHQLCGAITNSAARIRSSGSSQPGRVQSTGIVRTG